MMANRSCAIAMGLVLLAPGSTSGQTAVQPADDRAATVAATLPVEQPEAVGMSAEKLGLVEPAMQQMVDDGAVAGAVVGVARRGKVVLLTSVGFSDLEAKEPLEEDAILRFYSMTKPITSVAIMTLVEAGKIDLDAPVSDYLPEFEGLQAYVSGSGDDLQLGELERPMSVRDLLRHTSGLTYGYFGDTPVDKMYVAAGVLSPRDTLEQMAEKLSKLPLLYQPGRRFNYSVSTDVLGLIVQRVSGQPLDEFFEEQIFEPLGLRDTAFYAPASKADRLAVNYGPNPDGEGLRAIDAAPDSPFLKPPKLPSGGGGVVSTAPDYLRFCQMLLNQGELDGVQLLQPESVEAMTRNQLPESAYPLTLGGSRPGVGFGLGFSVVVEETPYTESSAVGEYGWGGAASTHFWISPEDELAVVALSQYMPYSSQLEDRIKPLVYESVMK